MQHNAVQHTATHCNTQQHTATQCNTLHCNILQDTAILCTATYALNTNGLCLTLISWFWGIFQLCTCPPGFYGCSSWCNCITLQHAATRCNALQRTATHCNALQRTATHCNALQRTATHCNTLQHTAAHCTTLQVCCSDLVQCIAVT